MRELKDIFALKGKKSHYPGREIIFNNVANGVPVPLTFSRDEYDKIIAINPVTGETVGFVPLVVCPDHPEVEEKYDLLECFVDMGIAKPTAIKKRRDNIIIEVSVLV